MISKTFCIARLLILAGCALSPAAWAANCTDASLSGAYGFLHNGIDSAGSIATGVTQVTFDPTTGTFTGEDTESAGGLITTASLTATYAVASDCTARAKVSLDGGPAANVSLVITPNGFLFLRQKPGATSDGYGVKQSLPSCTNAGLNGDFALESSGVYIEGAPVTGPVDFIGELTFGVTSSGDGVISGSIAGSVDGTILTFAEEPVTGSYSVAANCRGIATIAPKGGPPMNFSLVVVEGGKQMLAIETDAGTVVSATLMKGN